MKNTAFHFARDPSLTGTIQKTVIAYICGKPTQLAIVKFDGNPAGIPLRAKCEVKPGVKGYKLNELVIESKARIMYALINRKQKLLLAPDGGICDGLPNSFAGYFCFESKAEAKRISVKYTKPKFEVVPVSVDENGFPSPVLVNPPKKDRIKSTARRTKPGRVPEDFSDCIVARKLPKFLDSGLFYTEPNDNAHGRIIRVDGEYRTHNIDLFDNCLFWEDSDSEEYVFPFQSSAKAQQWWQDKFGKCTEFWSLSTVLKIKSR